MKKNHFLLVVSVLILLSAIILRIKQTGDKRKIDINTATKVDSSIIENYREDNLVGNDRDEHGCIASAGYSWCEPKAKCLRIWEEDCVLELEENLELDEEVLDSMPLVSSPLPGETVTSPLVIEGEAKGTWFFEANLPLKLIDSNNNIIAEGFALAQDDWMTEDYVPFVGSISYETEEEIVYLVIEKNNPSDLPEFDDQIIILLNL